MVDIGGGTTGTAVVRKGKVDFSGDQPTGGRHISLVIAGHYNIPFAEAEARKHRDDPAEILKLARPTLQRMSDIVAGHIKGRAVDRPTAAGGTCCLPGSWASARNFDSPCNSPAGRFCSPPSRSPP